MHASRIAALITLGSSLALLPACGSATTEPAQSAQSGVTRAPLSGAATAKGPAKWMAEAFADVPLHADQRAEIEQMFTDAMVRHEPVKKARADLALAVAAQVDAGAIDKTALQPKIDAVGTEMSKVQDADIAAVERLHAILDATQRTALVDAVEVKFLGRAAARVGVAQLGPQHIDSDHAGPPSRGGTMKQWADDLKLTDEQRAQITEKMHTQFAALAVPAEHDGPGGHGERHFGEMKEHLEKLKAAFESEHFVVTELMPKKDMNERAQKWSGHIIDMVSAALPVLTPEQRILAATKIRERANGQEEGP